MTNPTDPRPNETPSRYRKITREIATLAALEQLLKEPKVKVLRRTIDLPADVISELKLEYEARVKQLKTMVEGLSEVYQSPSKP